MTEDFVNRLLDTVLFLALAIIFGMWLIHLNIAYGAALGAWLCFITPAGIALISGCLWVVAWTWFRE